MPERTRARRPSRSQTAAKRGGAKEPTRDSIAKLEERVRARTRELAEASERLRRERQLSELLIESSTEGIVAIDRGYRHTIWNAALERLTGMPRAEVIGQPVTAVFPRIAGSEVEAAWRSALAGRTISVHGRRYDVPSTGRSGIYDADFAPLYGTEGAIIGAIAFLRDVSHRQQMEEILRQSQKMEAVGQLTGGVAHDFNNILTAIIGSLELVLGSDEPGEATRRLVAAALRSATRGARLTQQLLAFSRRQLLQPKLISINELLSEMQVLLQRAVGEAIEVMPALRPRLPLCRIDPAQFETAVLNLVINARDAMAEGGRLRIETYPTKVRGRSGELARGDYVVLAVTDTGTGMAPEVKARAFEPFFTTKEIGKGSGLGLSMVYGFAKQSAGTVEIDSRVGHGTTVRLYLPAAAPAPSTAGDEDRDSSVVGTGRGTVLMVEDDDEVRTITAAAIEALGYAVIAAANAAAALDLLREKRDIDVLVTDLVMPGGMNGLDLARAARALHRDLPVLLMSGYSPALAEIEAAPEFPFIKKPFRPAELGRAIGDLLRPPPPARA